MKLCALFAGFLLSSFAAFAQDWSGTIYKFEEIYPGYIVSQQGDTTQGYVLHGGRAFNQQRCVFYADGAKKGRRDFKPGELKAYGVADKHYRSIRFSGGLLAKPQSFVLLSKNGAISGFIYYNKKDDQLVYLRGANESLADFDARIHTEDWVLQKLNEQPIQQAELLLGFAKKVSKLVSEHTELATKVANKEKDMALPVSMPSSMNTMPGTI